MSHQGLFPRALERFGGARRTAAVFVASLAVSSLVAAGAPAAQAATGDLTCTAVYQINFSPALTPFSQGGDASVVVGLNNCLSLNGAHSELGAGLMTGEGTVDVLRGVPCSLVLTIDFDLRIEWSNGQVSKLHATVNSNPLKGTIGFSGVVTHGPLEGDTVYAIGPVAPNVDCLLRGLTSMAGVNQKIFS